MFSKNTFLRLLCYLILSFQMMGCDLPLNDAPPEPSELNAKLDGSQCLEGAMPAVTNFIKGTGNPNEIIGFWDCLGTAVGSFEKSTRGRYEDRFTARELGNFVERYFMPENQKISSDLMLEVFKVKQLFVGGGIDSISRVEMKNMITVFDQLKTISLHLLPYMRVYSMNWQTSPNLAFEDDIKYFENANLEIQQAAKDIADIIAKNGQAYKLESFVILLNELSKFDSAPWAWIDTIDDAMPLVYKLKKSLAGGKETEIEPLEWRRFFLLSARGYIQFLRYNYFIRGTAANGHQQELIYVTRTVDDLFSFVGDMVDGKAEKKLTRAELLDILQALARFIPEVKVTDSFLVELMKIKSVLFGGRLDYFEKTDFERARLKLETFRLLAEQFLNYSKVYTFAWKTNELSAEEKLTYFKSAESSLQAFAEKVGANLEGQYNLQDLIKLAKELDIFYGAKNPQKESLEARAKKLVPLLVTIKNIVLSDDGSFVGSVTNISLAQAQWKDFLGYAAQGFSKYLYFNYFVKGASISTGAGIAQAELLVAEATSYLEKILKIKTATGQQITFAEFDKLWKSLETANILPPKITAASLSSVTKALLARMLISPERRLAGAKINGLSLEALDNLKGEIAIWAGVQRFNDWLYKDVPAELGRPSAQINSALGSAPETDGLKELKMIYGSGMDISLDITGRMRITKPGVYYLRSTADFINIIRAADRLVMRGYGSDLARIKNYQGVTADEMNLLFNDIRGLLIEMDLVAPSNKTFGEARFRDGNLFTSLSNGNNYLDFREAAHVAMMIVSGLKIHSLFYEEIERKCPINTAVSRYKDEWTFEYKCITPIYKARLYEHLSTLPDMVYFLKLMSKEQQDEFYTNMMKAAGYSADLGPNIKLGDLAQFPHVSQYVEMIFQMYDTDRDGYLRTAEAMRAFPTFKNILLEASKGSLKKEKELKALFTWLLKYAKAPTSLGDKLKFITIWMMKGEKGWDVAADRGRLAKILGFIAEETAKAERAQAER